MKRRHRARIFDVADADPVRARGGGPRLRVGSEGRVARAGRGRLLWAGEATYCVGIGNAGPAGLWV